MCLKRSLARAAFGVNLECSEHGLVGKTEDDHQTTTQTLVNHGPHQRVVIDVACQETSPESSQRQLPGHHHLGFHEHATVWW